MTEMQRLMKALRIAHDDFGGIQLAIKRLQEDEEATRTKIAELKKRIIALETRNKLVEHLDIDNTEKR